ncbi:MAG: OPT/YSL family transporter [Candidatus Micrarchaeia archaeon]
MATQPFPYRAIVLGSILSVLVALYSSYAGLKIGGVYWPMVTTAVVSLAIVRLLGGKDKHETNVMQTAASTGGLLAAGVIFTIPALYLLGLPVSQMDILLVSLCGGLLGLLFVYPLREKMVVKDNLPYADGSAAAEIIKAGDSGGKKSSVLVGAFSLGAAFAIVRDVLALFPSYFNLESLKISAAKLFSFGSSISLIPFAGGYLIGFRFTLAWFIGAVASYFFIIPYTISSGMMPDKLAVMVGITKPLGTGIVIGAAIAYFITAGIPVFLKTAAHYADVKHHRKAGAALLALVVLITYAFNLSLPVALLAVIGAFFMAYVGARITGEMNVDPMEIFAMVVLLAAKYLFGFTALHLVLVAAVVCIAAGIAGDAMQDFKTGHLLGTKPEHQLAAEIAGVVSASLVMGLLMHSFAQVGFGTLDFPAPQAMAVKEVVSAKGMPSFLLLGIALGAVATYFLHRWKKGEIGAAPVAFGIGLYVPIELSVPLFIGGVASYFVSRAKKTEFWRLVAGGVIAGEGIVGAILVLAAAAKFFGV